MHKIKVGLVGYGSQGRRIAEAISVQKDMELTGICLKEPDISALMAARKGFVIYLADSHYAGAFKKTGIDVQGSISSLLYNVDVVVDVTPSGVGKKNKEKFYSKYDVKAVFQAGEPFEVADIQVFMSTINYNEARKASSVRVPSPFAVYLTRILKPLDVEFGIKHTTCTLILPGTEPMRGHHGPVDTIIPDKPYVAHDTLRVEMQQMLPRSFTFTSFAVPSILLAVGAVVVDLEQTTSTENVIDLLCRIPRSILVRSDMGLHSTDAIFEYIRRVARPSADIYEVCTWREHVEAINCRLKLVQAFDPHCVQTPEVIDAIRALASEEKMEESFNRTNEALGLLSPGIYP
ncbi:type II glyceraldehyde-3-phosphate dehydrogenase [Candidatus Bathyarchaeota archaeon]|nr:type II glyceraldehyde-3-phosphate dehydrogenase [Candidatus Bathyarchaeota archaeon]